MQLPDITHGPMEVTDESSEGGADGGDGSSGGRGGAAGRGGGDWLKHIFQPGLVTSPSECHLISPSTGMIPTGPVVPQYLELAMRM